jgi:hypothetical protein
LALVAVIFELATVIGVLSAAMIEVNIDCKSIPVPTPSELAVAMVISLLRKLSLVSDE